jgi:hypothetical protein
LANFGQALHHLAALDSLGVALASHTNANPCTLNRLRRDVNSGAERWARPTGRGDGKRQNPTAARWSNVCRATGIGSSPTRLDTANWDIPAEISGSALRLSHPVRWSRPGSYSPKEVLSVRLSR